ncbi:hypothetical protein K9N68_29030 [Kovacikia minuta CCNUW1]|uniref:hypothetical protein n=1 Tax=Kovacikia minuta TaxID=2931930 RepID=UPI001CCF392D|nr:hypothetical protein [Kovacikia minuta]UBF25576.1 hypothetical protein K9N68_29030 [Kovacikia minuta CCNUW1]
MMGNYENRLDRIEGILQRTAEQQELNTQAIANLTVQQELSRQDINQLTANLELTRQDINQLTANIEGLRNQAANYLAGREQQ